MAKESRSKGGGSNKIPNTDVPKAEANSGPAGGRGQTDDPGNAGARNGKPAPVFGLDVWTNDRGEKCIGNECFAVAIKPGEDDVTIRVDRNKCGVDMEDMVNDMFQAIGRGGRTVYESTSKVKNTDE